ALRSAHERVPQSDANFGIGALAGSHRPAQVLSFRHAFCQSRPLDRSGTSIGADEDPMAAQELRHKVRDIGVRMWRGGDGAALVYLHGAAGVPGWLPFFEKLAARYDVLVPEHPGFGNSDNPAWIRNVGDVAL